jgi:hypothetical protein
MTDEIAAFRDRPRVVAWWLDGSSFVLTRFLVLRLLGVVYFVAFASAYVQAPALIGDHGIWPARGQIVFPSLFALSTSDAMLHAALGLGAVLAALVVFGLTNAGAFIALWFLQLSLANAGHLFWGYGWEIQLCETGMIAVFMCPLTRASPWSSGPPLATIWLLRWLIVRIMLGAGLIKLRGDSCWRDLTCLAFHYETQPNPSPVSWLLNQAPPWFHRGGVLFNHLVELGAPALVLGPRAARRIAAALFLVFQVILIVSGNLSFLNWLTIVPALACLDDALILRLVPSSLERRLRTRIEITTLPARPQRIAANVFAGIVALLSLGPTANLFSDRQAMNASFDPLHLVNTYGAFGSVSRVRHEIIIEGTRDEAIGEGTQWAAYEFPCKPGDPMRRPCLITPWHYRLDWQLWFAAMSRIEYEPWLLGFVDALLRGDKTVSPLIAHDPFPGAPPRWIRAELYRYEFTRFGEGPAWWKRTDEGEYFRPILKEDPDLAIVVRALHDSH